MLLSPVELRVKNFNFFLVIVGAIVLALRQWDDSGIRALLSLVGASLGVVFLLLDARTFQLIKDARHDLYRIEKLFGITIHDVDRVADPRRDVVASGRLRIRSHTFCYRFVFVLVTVLFAAAAVKFGRLL